CSDYFCSLTPLPYRAWVVINGVACAVVANVGLSQLIALSIPVLVALYPVAIALVVLAFVRHKMPNPKVAFRVVTLVAFLFALI
ncbi:branched-chain amino acid transport system II carrier protein, partial [Bradyrhizobium sp. 23AC]